MAVAAASKRLPRPRATAAPTRPPQPGVCARGRRGRARCAGTTTLPALLARIKPARCGTLYYFACTYYFACSARVSRYVPSIFVQTCYARLSLTPSHPRRRMLGLTFGRRVVKFRCPLRARSCRPAGYPAPTHVLLVLQHWCASRHPFSCLNSSAATADESGAWA